jgi:hypothetical protein
MTKRSKLYGREFVHRDTLRAIEEVLVGDFKSAATIGAMMCKSADAADQMLRRLYKKGLVERVEEKKENGGIRFRYRAVPAGYSAPLYDAQPGLDMRALAECFGGYTYLQAKNHTTESK